MRRILCMASVLVGLGACASETDAAVADRRAFLPLGSLSADVAEPSGPVWLGSDEADELADALEDEGLDEAVDALEAPPAEGTRGAAFVLAGCAETSVRLTIEDETLVAELTGGENVDCGVANYFLAVFDIPEEKIPDQ